MTDITTAIDPEAAHREWTRRLEYHLGLVPKLLGAALTLAEPNIGVSRAGSQFDRPQITGGGYYDAIPKLTIDHRAAADATYLWDMFREYVEAVAAWLGASVTIPAKCPGSSKAAHDTALVIVGTLEQHADLIWEHRQLDEFEQSMFAEIRAQQRRYLPKHDGLPQHARTCVTCGSERSVRVVWADGLAGSPKPRQIGSCRVCGETYEPNEGETDD